MLVIYATLVKRKARSPSSSRPTFMLLEKSSAQALKCKQLTISQPDMTFDRWLSIWAGYMALMPLI